MHHYNEFYPLGHPLDHPGRHLHYDYAREFRLYLQNQFRLQIAQRATRTSNVKHDVGVSLRLSFVVDVYVYVVIYVHVRCASCNPQCTMHKAHSTRSPARSPGQVRGHFASLET